MSMQALPLGYMLPLAQSETVTQQCTVLSPHPHPPHLNGLPSLPRLNPRPAHMDLWALFLAAAAAAKSLQSCPTLCDPIDGSPPGSPVPGILQARLLEWGAIAFSVFLATLPLLSMAQSTYFLSICISSLGAFGNQSPQTEGRSRRLNS